MKSNTRPDEGGEARAGGSQAFLTQDESGCQSTPCPYKKPKGGLGTQLPQKTTVGHSEETIGEMFSMGQPSGTLNTASSPLSQMPVWDL